MTIHSMEPRHERELGILHARVDHIQEDVKEIKGDVKLLLNNEAKKDGATKILIGIITIISGIVGAVASRLMNLL